MPILEDHHDFGHPVEGDGAWSESYYFNAYDAGAETGFFTRVGIRPNEGTIDAHLGVWLPTGDIAHLRAELAQSGMVDSHLAVGPVSYDCRVPMREWRLRARGTALVQALAGHAAVPAGNSSTCDVDIDVRFASLTPPIGADGQGRGQAGAAGAAGASIGKGHFEQAGRWSGTVTVDGETRHLTDARGNRDKSWGPRRWDQAKMWRWFSVNIGDDVAFGGIRLGTDAGDLHRGWVWRDGAATSVAEWRVRTELADDELTQRVVHLTVVDKAGRSHQLRGDLLRVAPLPRASATGTTLVNEGLTSWSYEGRTGTGIAEYLHQLDAHGRPAVPVT